jgi:hypothetical protein
MGGAHNVFEARHLGAARSFQYVDGAQQAGQSAMLLGKVAAAWSAILCCVASHQNTQVVKPAALPIV